IAELLASSRRLHPHDHLKIQSDTVSAHARSLLPDLLRLLTPATPQETDAVALLKAWDGDMHTGSAGAAIFAAWWLRLSRGLLEPEMEPRQFRVLERWGSFVDRAVRRALRDAQTVGDADLRARRATIVHDCFRDALQDLERRLGPD